MAFCSKRVIYIGCGPYELRVRLGSSSELNITGTVD